MLIRPVTLADHAAVLKLAQTAGFGMTSLPADEQVLRAKIERAVASFEGDAAQKGDEAFLFVMQDSATGQVIGTAGIKAHIGLSQPFYSYKVITIAQQCKELNIFSKHEMLQVTNDLTGASEIGSLFLLPAFRRDRLGRLLSLCRFMFIAKFQHFFADQVIAEMRGVSDLEGNSPFYDSLARSFFEMEFHKADYINATCGNQFINDLMPKYPIYVSLLPKSARDVIGQPHPNSVPARSMLEHQGFRWQGYVDIFDGGPTLQAAVNNLRIVRESQLLPVTAIDDSINTEKFMLSNDQFATFRCCAARALVQDSGVIISSKASRLLQVGVGDSIRIATHQTGLSA